jgi:hypothetical protein
MYAFQNIIDLRFAVADHVGSRAISDVFPRLVALAEDDMNYRLRTRMQIRDYTLTFDEEEAPLPPDFLELISIKGCGPGKFQVGPLSIRMPGRGGDYEAQYYARLPSITCSPTATNWILQRYPTVYLYGTALQAAKHLRNAEVALATSPLYAEALQLLKVDDERARWSAASVRVGGLAP